MNVYDFDKTIYKRDSNTDFYLYCLGRRPWMIIYLPRQLSGLLGYMLGRGDLTRAKARFMSYLKHLPDPQKYAREFWDKRQKDIYDWYLEKRAEGDVIISASPGFLLAPVCERLGAALIATEVDPATGEFLSENNRGPQKPRRFFELYPDGVIDEFYSDSISDEPMARLAKAAYLVNRGRLTPWYGAPTTLKQRLRERIFGR